MTDNIDMSDPAILTLLDQQYDILKACLRTMDRRYRALMLLSAVVDSAHANNVSLPETLSALCALWRWTEERNEEEYVEKILGLPDDAEVH
jgi:hypothetical protein